MEKLSAYVLTKDSEKYLKEILLPLTEVAEDVLVLDSGSKDKTEAIAKSIPGVRFEFHPFEDFKSQRTIAAERCLYDMILFLDSDEIPSDNFVQQINQLKKEGFQQDAYSIKRFWKVLGKDVHCIYPIVSPDFPIRMYRKSKVSFANSNLVHETPSGFASSGLIDSAIMHITFHSKEELFQKLDFYTDIAAQDLLRRKKTVSKMKLWFSPFASFYKWYIAKGGYKDGRLGITLALYAFQYTRKKYMKALRLKLGNSQNKR